MLMPEGCPAKVTQNLRSSCSVGGHATQRLHGLVPRKPLHAGRAHAASNKRYTIPATTAILKIFQGKQKAKILRSGTPVLRKVAGKVPESMFGTEGLRKLVTDMVTAMREAPGVGLAAPQIGISMQIIVLEDRPEYVRSLPPGKAEQLQRRPFELIAICNPKLKPVGRSGARFYEGCLSVPGYQAVVDRYATVEVTGFTPEGKPLQFQASGWQARILQHECDHIRGTLYVDRMHSRTFVHASVMPTQDFEAAMSIGSCSCSHSID